ncbi:TadE/TadG family type IV pilus assembly protein [Aporhodopirellula aestuarii]|uniref:Pilus assembly protein n=1 Tax=Aporhodopirellula aestuarii TaxID=2950107 RepID=A0ABT0U2Y9_9BACT|nr:TadE family protein [Aporhodopirellula aestuarii]MCM2370961.1 pilus assembly protein [Aporhodopirellula aestuarii]
MRENVDISKPRQGAVVVEFAITMTVLLMLVFGAIEMVRLSMLRQSVEYSSYLAARKGMIIGANSSDVENEAINYLDAIGIQNATVSVTPSKITDDTEIVEVNVTVPVQGNSWVSPVYFSGDLTGRTRMFAERAAAKMTQAVAPPATP